MRLGLIGLGHIARTHLAAAAALSSVQIVAATRSRSAAATLAEYPHLRLFDAADALLDDPDLDGVIVCVPTFAHQEVVTAAARAGKHILCEKPIALDEAGAEHIVDAARKAGVTLMIGQVLRFWPEYVRLRELVQQGTIGDVRAVSAWRLAEYPPWSDWFRDPRKSGGCLLDLHIHDIDFLYSLCGLPKSVYARGIQSGSGSWDHVNSSLDFDQSTASVEGTYLMPPGWPFRMGLRVVGSMGALEFNWSVAGNVGERTAALRGLTHYPHDGAPTAVLVENKDAYAEQLQYFAGQVESGLEPDRCPPLEAIVVMRIMAACRASIESGRPIELAR